MIDQRADVFLTPSSRDAGADPVSLFTFNRIHDIFAWQRRTENKFSELWVNCLFILFSKPQKTKSDNDDVVGPTKQNKTE